jgi:signal peptidase I
MQQDVALPISAEPLPTSGAGGIKKFGVELAQTIILVAVLFFGVRTGVQNFRVEGPSMQPTLTSGEFLWVNKIAFAEWDGQYLLGGPQRGDIVVLRSPDPSEDVDLIKRVIGLPGERIRIEHGDVFINGRQLDEPYITYHAGYNFPADGIEAVVPAGQYFVIGDNRVNSRVSHLGWYVPADHLVGRAWLSYWPPAAWGVMPAVAYANE